MNLDPKLKAEILAYVEFSRKTREAADELIAAWRPAPPPLSSRRNPSLGGASEHMPDPHCGLPPQ